ETTFYKVGVTVDDARTVLEEQLGHLETFARWIAAYVASRAIDRPEAIGDRAFVESLDVESLRFDAPAFAQRSGGLAGSQGTYDWPFDPKLYDVMRTPMREAAKRALKRSA